MPRPRLPHLLAAILPLAGCVDRPVTKLDPIPENTENLEFSVTQNPNLDLLFVIDNSRSMANEQASITANFSRMIEVLEQLPAGLPSIHLGVVSTDVGAGGACAAPSPGPGVLRNQPHVQGCTGPTDRWISDEVDAAGNRVRNYDGTLADTFSCIATLGTNGCGYEQPLESIRRALDPATLENQGFLRPDSLLAVVILSDEDDCSAFDTSLFDEATPDGVDGDFRCFAEGVECDGPPEQHGTRENCVAREDSPFITPVADLAAELRAHRPLASQLLVAGILGDADVRVGINDKGDLDVLTSCQPDAGNPEGAYPATRTDAFLSQFSEPIRTRICDADLSPAIVEIGRHIVDRMYGGCVQGQLADPAAPDCSVAEIAHPGKPGEATTILPQCDNPDGEAATNQPCWTIEHDDVCQVGDHLRVTTHYGDQVRDADTLVRAQCRLVPGA